jgi:kynurenine formamidase
MEAPNQLRDKIDQFESFGITPLQEMNSSFFSSSAYETLLHSLTHFDV